MIVVSGEALMDVFAAGDTATGLMLDARIGGSPLNVATGLARLGQPAAFFGAISSGFLGDRLLHALHAEGVDTRCTVRNAAPTTLGLVGLDAAGVPSYAFYGADAADRQLPLSAVDLVPAAAAYHFGSYAMVVEPVASAQRALVERECRRSVIAYDPNIRLNVEPDLQRWRDTLAWMLPRTHLLKVSDEDLGLLYPGADIGALAAQWLAAGVALVVVTRGAQGAWAWTATQHVAAAPVAVDVVDTVGAGDSFQAALLAALAERGLLNVSAIGASAAEGIEAKRVGREPSLSPDSRRVPVGTQREAGAKWDSPPPVAADSLLPPTLLGTIDTPALTAVLQFATRAAAITCSRRGADLPLRAGLG